MIRNTLFVAACLALPALAQPVVVIDDFSSGFFNITANSGTPIVEAVRAGGMIGGERDALLQWMAGPQSIRAEVANGVHFLNSDSQTSGTLFLQYDGFDGEIEGDLTQTDGTALAADLSGENRLQYSFDFVDDGFGGADLNVATTIVSSAGTATVVTAVDEGMNIVMFQNFSSFTGVDFSDVDRIEVELRGATSSDFTLNDISAVPEPASLAVLAMAGGLLMRQKRRR